MCVVSMIEDHYGDRWRIPPNITHPSTGTGGGGFREPNEQVRQELEDLKDQVLKELSEFRKLLEKAKEYDERTDQPDCENAGKRAALLEIADQLGLRDEIQQVLDEVLG